MKEQSIDEAVTILQKYGSEAKKRNTPERVAILRVAYSTDKTFSMQWLEDQLKKDSYTNTISLASVYNAMKIFVTCKLFVEMSLGDNRLSFSHTVGAKNRIILKCTEPNCNSVVNRELPEVEELRQLLKKRYGFTTNTHAIVMNGKCDKH